MAGKYLNVFQVSKQDWSGLYLSHFPQMIYMPEWHPILSVISYGKNVSTEISGQNMSFSPDTWEL